MDGREDDVQGDEGQDLGLGHEELYEGGCVLDGPADTRQGLLDVAKVVVMLSQEVEGP